MKQKISKMTLRPNGFNQFVGQDKIKKTLEVVIDSSNIQKIILDHILFYGPPGLGKTTLATLIAKKTNRNIIYTQGSLLNQKSDLLTILASLKQNDILFIDEIHSINKHVEELLYLAMEDFVIDINFGPEGENKNIRMNINPFTLIGATTKIELLSNPIKDRFGLVFKLKPYNEEEISKIIIQSANFLKIKISKNDALLIAKFSQNTPRLANHIIKRIKDFCIHYNKNEVNEKIIYKTLENLNIYVLGLNQNHIDYLQLLFNKFLNKNVSLSVISSLLKESEKMIVDFIEPTLLLNNLIIKTSKGRTLTSEGIKYLEKINNKIKSDLNN